MGEAAIQPTGEEIRRQIEVIRFDAEMRRARNVGKVTPEAKARFLMQTARRLQAPSANPIFGVNPLDGTALVKVRYVQAEGWVNVYEARLRGDTGMVIKALRELRNAVMLEAELRGEIASRSSVQAVQVNVNQGGETETLIERLRKVEADDPVAARGVAKLYGLPVLEEAEPSREDQLEELARLRRENDQLRESQRIAEELAGRGEGERTGGGDEPV